MKAIQEFENQKLDTSALYHVVVGCYKKTDCGTVDVGGGMVMGYKCDVVDSEGKKPPYYFDTVIHPN